MSLGRGAAFSLILAVLAAGTAWVVVQGDPAIPPGPAAPGGRPEAPRPEPPRPEADGPAPSARAAPRPAPPRAAAGRPARKRLGAGLVIGRIVDPAGRPVTGANVYLVGAATEDPPFLGAPRDRIAHARQRAVEGARFRYEDPRTRQSRDDGSFVFLGSDVPDADRVELHVLLGAGGVPLLEPEPIVLDDAERAGRIVTVACHWGGMVEFACLAPAMSAPELRVTLTLACEDGGTLASLPTSLSLEHGRVRLHGLPPGRYAAWAQSAASLAVSPFFRVEEGARMRVVELAAGPAALVVRVLDDRGQPYRRGADVIVAGSAARELGPGIPFELRLPVSRYETTATFTGLPEGQVRIEIAPTGEKRAAARTVVLGRGIREERFLIAPPPPKPCVVQGAVQALGSLPLLATLRIHDATSAGRPALVKECCTDPEGRFLIEGLPEKSLVVLVSAPGHQKRLVRMEPRPDRATDVCWVLVPQAEGVPPVAADPDVNWGAAGGAAQSILELFEKPAPRPPESRPQRGGRHGGARLPERGPESGRADGGEVRPGFRFSVPEGKRVYRGREAQEKKEKK